MTEATSRKSIKSSNNVKWIKVVAKRSETAQAKDIDKLYWIFASLWAVICLGWYLSWRYLNSFNVVLFAAALLPFLGFIFWVFTMAVSRRTGKTKMKSWLRLAAEKMDMLKGDTDDRHATKTVVWYYRNIEDMTEVELLGQGRGINSDDQIRELADKLAEVLEDLSGIDWIFDTWRPDKRKGIIFVYSHSEDERLEAVY